MVSILSSVKDALCCCTSTAPEEQPHPLGTYRGGQGGDQASDGQAFQRQLGAATNDPSGQLQSYRFGDATLSHPGDVQYDSKDIDALWSRTAALASGSEPAHSGFSIAATARKNSLPQGIPERLKAPISKVSTLAAGGSLTRKQFDKKFGERAAVEYRPRGSVSDSSSLEQRNAVAGGSDPLRRLQQRFNYMSEQLDNQTARGTGDTANLERILDEMQLELARMSEADPMSRSDRAGQDPDPASKGKSREQ
jgi:hypothetical protein